MDLVTKSIKLIRIAMNQATLRALLRGSAAGVEHEPVLRSMGPCNCVVDIGANRGQFALVSRKVWPSAVIHSFEPLDEPLHVLNKVFHRDVRLHIHPYAIGPKRGEAIIHVSQQDDSSSLLPISNQQSLLFPGTGEKETRNTIVRPLDDELKHENISRPAMLKIDVQGYELYALQGTENLLNYFDYVYVECSFIELYMGQALAYQVIAYLYQHGFCLSGIYNLTYRKTGQAVQGDFLFHRCTRTESEQG